MDPIKRSPVKEPTEDDYIFYGHLPQSVTVQKGLVYIFELGTDSETDVKDIMKIFPKVNLSKMYHYLNKPNEEIIDILTKVTTADPDSFDCLVTIILGANKKNEKFYNTRNDKPGERTILDVYFTRDLVLKPKLLIVEFKKYQTVNTDLDENNNDYDRLSEASQDYRLPKGANTVIIQNYSGQDANEKNQFICNFCSNIDRLQGKTNLLQIITDTLFDVKEQKQSLSRSFPQVLRTLTTDVFLEIKGNKINTSSAERCYETNGKKGILYIVNYDKDRKGYDKDVSRLGKCFKSLGFKVQTVSNMSYDELKQIFSNGNINTDKYSSMVVVIASHGTKFDFVTETKTNPQSKRMQLDEFINFFTTKKAPMLKEIPKIIILQTCRGVEQPGNISLQGEVEGGTTTKNDVTTNSKADAQQKVQTDISHVTIEEDYLIFHATLDGQQCYRNVEHGTTFLQVLCDAIERVPEGYDVSLADLTTQVSREVSLKCITTEEGIRKQMPMVASTLTKNLQLGPIRKMSIIQRFTAYCTS